MACIGLVTNILGIISLSRCKTKTMFSLLLSAVLVFDAMYLFCSLLNSVKSRFVSLPIIILRLCSVLVYPGLRFSLISSIYTTVALSHSRFSAVNNPVVHRNAMSSQGYRTKYFCKYLFAIIVLSVIVTLPCFWEFEIKNVLSNTTNPTLEPSNMRQSPYYSIFYVGILSLGVNGLFPFLSLVYFTIHIARGIRRNSMSLTGPRNTGQSNIRISSNRNRPSMVVNLISVLFLTFHSLRQGMTIAEFVIQAKKLNNDQYEVGCESLFWLNVFASISDFLLVVNSSVNTIVYKVVFWKYSPTEERSTQVISTQRTSTRRRFLSNVVRRIESQSDTDHRILEIPLLENQSPTSVVTINNSSIELPCTSTADTTPNENTTPTVLVHKEVSSTRSEPQTFIELSHGDEYEYV